MKVPMLNPALGNAPFMEELEDAALKVLRSGQYILGKTVEDFEEAMANYVGVKHAIGVSSGSDALVMSLMALGIGPGDEVICPSFTFFATAGAIARVGATPVFVDVDFECFTMNPCSLKEAITPRTRAIIPVHLFGQCANMNRINEIAELYDIPVIEDACQSIGAYDFDFKKAGAMGTCGCFSFFPSKNLGGFGDAGLITTDDSELAEKLYKTRNHGCSERYYHDFVGGNFRIDALQAALLQVKLKHLPDMEAERIKHAKMYSNELATIIPRLVLPFRSSCKHVYNQFTVKTQERDKLQKHLQNNDVGCAVYYPLPLHRQKCFRTTAYLRNTDLVAKQVLSIPVAAEITEEQIEFVIEKVKEFYV